MNIQNGMNGSQKSSFTALPSNSLPENNKKAENGNRTIMPQNPIW